MAQSISNFEIATLKSDDELDPWLDHVAYVFTSTPRSYFENHYKSDPKKTLDGNCF
jgi:hypothetical protein